MLSTGAKVTIAFLLQPFQYLWAAGTQATRPQAGCISESFQLQHNSNKVSFAGTQGHKLACSTYPVWYNVSDTTSNPVQQTCVLLVSLIFQSLAPRLTSCTCMLRCRSHSGCHSPGQLCFCIRQPCQHCPRFCRYSCCRTAARHLADKPFALNDFTACFSAACSGDLTHTCTNLFRTEGHWR